MTSVLGSKSSCEFLFSLWVVTLGLSALPPAADMLSVGIVTAEVSEKHSELDWTDDELVALLNERRESREGAARSDDGESESDSVQ